MKTIFTGAIVAGPFVVAGCDLSDRLSRQTKKKVSTLVKVSTWVGIK